MGCPPRFDKPPGKQNGLPKSIAAVTVARGRRFLIEIEGSPGVLGGQQIKRLFLPGGELIDRTIFLNRLQATIDALQ